MSSPILTTTDSTRLHSCSLVLSAVRIGHQVSQNTEGNWQITVEEADREIALNQWQQYEQENLNWPLQSSPATSNFSPVFKAQSILLVIMLALFHTVTGEWSQQSFWFDAGAVNSNSILEDGEYYRLLTGLTLHSDLVHLLGNCLLGGFLLHYYFLLVGNGIGITALLFSSTLANYLNTLGHGPGHLSVGFSTAVFAAVGMLAMINYRQYKLHRPRTLLFPLMAGAALLAMLGSSGERTDHGAHFYGLVTGLITGAMLGSKIVFRLRHNGALQTMTGTVGLLIPFLAWYLALG